MRIVAGSQNKLREGDSLTKSIAVYKKLAAPANLILGLVSGIKRHCSVVSFSFLF
jgi:hypothetical protein